MTTLDTFWKATTPFFAFLTMVIVLVSVILSADKENYVRQCFTATNAQIVGGGEAAAVIVGKITMNFASNSFDFDAVYPTDGNFSGISAMTIRGPMEPGVLNSAPVAADLCGAYTTACDTTSTPGAVSGRVFEVFNGVSPVPMDIRPVMSRVRADPHLYYLEILTHAKPISPGGARATLGDYCGPK
jgi:hypothetical protein